MTAWKCGACAGKGDYYTERDGSFRWHKCEYCRGSGEGWGPTVIACAGFAALLALFIWVCEGAPLP